MKDLGRIIFISLVIGAIVGCATPVQPPSVPPKSTSDFKPEDAKPMIVKVMARDSQGTGFIIGFKDNNAYILTAFHVVKDLDKTEDIDIETTTKIRLTARILSTEEDNDIAILQTNSLINNLNICCFLRNGVLYTSKYQNEIFLVQGFSPMYSRILKTDVKYPTPEGSSSLIFTGQLLPDGLSGSPVFRKKTGEIVGLVVTSDPSRVGSVPSHILRAAIQSIDGLGEFLLKQQDTRHIKIPSSSKSPTQKKHGEPKKDKQSPHVIIADDELQKTTPMTTENRKILYVPEPTRVEQCSHDEIDALLAINPINAHYVSIADKCGGVLREVIRARKFLKNSKKVFPTNQHLKQKLSNLKKRLDDYEYFRDQYCQ